MDLPLPILLLYRNGERGAQHTGYGRARQMGIRARARGADQARFAVSAPGPVAYTLLRAHETEAYLACRLLLEKKNANMGDHVYRVQLGYKLLIVKKKTVEKSTEIKGL